MREIIRPNSFISVHSDFLPANQSKLLFKSLIELATTAKKFRIETEIET